MVKWSTFKDSDYVPLYLYITTIKRRGHVQKARETTKKEHTHTHTQHTQHMYILHRTAPRKRIKQDTWSHTYRADTTEG
jgi:hypothetical protein